MGTIDEEFSSSDIDRLSNSTKKPRFIADVMLGKLARWLRIVGYDVEYFNDIDDRELAKIAAQDGRMILTRDTRLIENWKIRNYLLIKSTDPKKQFEQVRSDLGLETSENIFTRCLICNCEIVSIDKKKVRDKVPEYIYKIHKEFSRCPSCSRIYWAGTHLQSVLRRLDSRDKNTNWH